MSENITPPSLVEVKTAISQFISPYVLWFTLYLPFNMDQLNIGTYNVYGLNSSTLLYIDDVMSNYDFLFIQEHWRFTSQLHLFEDNIKSIHSYGISGMDEFKMA